MKRRTFFKTTLALGGVAALPGALTTRAAESTPAGAREFYELRQYRFRRGPMTKLFDDYASKAAIPALNRLGIGPIGVFNVQAGSDTPSAYVLIPYKSLDQFATASERLRADAEYQRAGAPFIDAPPTEPGYIRVESSLMIAFEGMAKLEVPAATAAGKARLFELRIYESHSKKANKTKVKMFNEGEIAIFRRTGLTPVFFGETLIGAKLPNLTYMLVFESNAERDKNWGTFVADPEWKKLSTTPGYTDPEIVSNITNLFLRPAAYSQV